MTNTQKPTDRDYIIFNYKPSDIKKTDKTNKEVQDDLISELEGELSELMAKHARKIK